MEHHAFGQQAHTAKDQPARAKAVATVRGTCVGYHGELAVTTK